MRELVSKVEGRCMSLCFHMASRARTRAKLNGWGGTGVGHVFGGGLTGF